MAAIYRRGKRYWARAQRKGREYRRSLATTNRAVAERRFREWLEELDAIAYGDKPRRTWEEASERFIREHLPTIKRSAAVRYGVSLKHLDEHFAGKMLHQITSAEMSEFEAKRRAQGVSTSTIRRDLACLSSLLTSAQDWSGSRATRSLASCGAGRSADSRRGRRARATSPRRRSAGYSNRPRPRCGGR